MIVPTGFAFVEPASSPTLPIVDSLTRKATGLWRSCSTPGRAYRGVHDCTGHRCTASSDNLEHFTPDGRPTHSLLVHYVACHRDAVPADDLVYLAGLTAEVEPTAQELGAPVVGHDVRVTRGSVLRSFPDHLPPIGWEESVMTAIMSEPAHDEEVTKRATVLSMWSGAFWETAQRIAAAHGFCIEPGHHKDHYRLCRLHVSPDTIARKKACLTAFASAGLPGGWVS